MPDAAEGISTERASWGRKAPPRLRLFCFRFGGMEELSFSMTLLGNKAARVGLDATGRVMCAPHNFL